MKVQLDWHAKQDKVYLTDNTETPTPVTRFLMLGLEQESLTRRGIPFSIFPSWEIIYLMWLTRII